MTLPDGFPDTEVPVVSGKLLSAERRTDADGWTVRVAVDGDDALTRAATALRQADAVVGQRDAAVVTPMTGAFATRTWFDDTGDSGTSDRQAQLADLQEELAELQAQRDAAAAEVADGEQALDALVASDAQQDSLSWAARQLQTAKDGLAGLDTRIEAKQLEITSQQMLVNLDAATAEQQRQLDAARAAAAASQAESYTFVGSSTLTATTHTWSVDVDQSRLDGRTVLTYTLTKH